MAKLKRSALIHWIDATPASTASYYLIGKDVEDMSVELNPQINTQKNILDQTSVTHEGYEPSMAVDTYFADPSEPIYDFLEAIALQRLQGDACKTKILEAIIEDTTAASHEAYLQDCIVEVTSYGGAQGGVRIPYTVHYVGERKPGTVAINSSTGVPTFTPASGG